MKSKTEQVNYTTGRNYSIQHVQEYLTHDHRSYMPCVLLVNKSEHTVSDIICSRAHSVCQVYLYILIGSLFIYVISVLFDSQKKYSLGTVSKNILQEGLNPVSRRANLTLSSDVDQDT